MPPDHYAVLGVPRDATAEDIKKAYRRLARESHPDAHPNDPHAEERFKELGQAYAVLSDADKRARFDRFGDEGPQVGGFGDAFDIFETFFGGSGFGGRGRAQRRTSAVPGQDLGIAVVLTLEEAVSGARRQIDVDGVDVCSACDGSGCAEGTSRATCANCKGQGELRQARNTILGTVMTSRPCPACAGVGEAPTDPCPGCRGAGRVRAKKSLTVDIPAGVDEGTTLRLRGRGEAGVRGGGDGDLFVQISVAPHDVFVRDGANLRCQLDLPVTQAVLGAEIEVPALEGTASVRIAPGTQHGTIIRVRGKGAGTVDGRTPGDLLVHVSLVVPKNISSEEREAFEKIAQLRGETVVGESRGLLGRLRDQLLGQ